MNKKTEKPESGRKIISNIFGITGDHKKAMENLKKHN